MPSCDRNEKPKDTLYLIVSNRLKKCKCVGFLFPNWRSRIEDKTENFKKIKNEKKH